MIRNKTTAGPFAKGENMHGHAYTTDLRITEELAFYDGPIYSIAEGGGKVFLRVDDMTGAIKGSGNEFPYRMRSVVHFLEFENAKAAKATLHEGSSPTRTSYKEAKSIIREVTTWTLAAPCKGENYRVEACELDLEDFIEADMEDELPEAKYLPSPDSSETEDLATSGN
ncbi:hypothetical protein [Erythrobacter aureus]|uniref:Uncharacterized protein n=1 Tax=Erythrobacter aureus TaxID=2182384 RepID=A0A345YJB2_9SPHN|nr:hypothetical protein [Erythrobacter aureus]AXK44014.1 hypothetical protein DVR09_16300 [Erythrobacter aureus]